MKCKCGTYIEHKFLEEFEVCSLHCLMEKYRELEAIYNIAIGEINILRLKLGDPKEKLTSPGSYKTSEAKK